MYYIFPRIKYLEIYPLEMEYATVMSLLTITGTQSIVLMTHED